MIKKLLSGRVRYTLSECAQEWDCPEQAILELATRGEIHLQAYLESVSYTHLTLPTKA